MGPDELDDILASIRAEGKRESALALYEGKGEEDLVDENVDERILKLLGLDDVFDIDYGTYISLLKGRLQESRSFGKKLSTEEDELLVEEFKKVKGKVGRFKIKRKKITAENIGVTGPVKVSTERFYLTSKAIIPQPPVSPDGEPSEDIKDISEALDELLKSIIGENKAAKKKAEEDRKADEQKRRTKREAELEKPFKAVASLVKKVVAPFQSILDRIMRFIQFTLIGFLVDKVLKWFADPANEKKVKLIGRFLKDWWPALLTAYGLFATPFGAFVRGTLKMLRTFIPQLVRFAAAHPLLASAAAIGTATFAGEMWRQGEEKKQIQREATQRNVKPEVVSKELEQAKRSPFAMFGEAMQNVGITGFNRGGKIKRRSFLNGGEIDARDISFKEGGAIDSDSGVRITGAGPDTQLIAAQPGEIVMSKQAVKDHGANFFLGLNRRSGASNIPRMVNNIQLAQGGGLIKKPIKSFQGGGMIGVFGRTLNFLGGLGLPSTGSVMAPEGRQWQGQGTVLNQILGFPVSKRQTTYSQSDINRYNKFSKDRKLISGSEMYKGPAGQYMANMTKTVPSGGGLDPFRNFGTNVKNVKGAAKRQEQMMRQMGYEPDGYVNLRGQPINLGPQSRAMPVGTPTIISRTQTIVLPPQKMPGQKPSVPVKTGTQIPDVKTIAVNLHRERTIAALGISDLMGAA